VLGVVLGIAVIEAIQSLGVELQGAVDIIGFSEEEGIRYSLPYLGSMAIVGKFDPANFDRVDSDGISMRTALETFGLQPDDYLQAKLSTSEYVAYLEAHIEQGPVLEALQQPLSVVESIVGQSRLWFVAEGLAGHAGTLPMRMRRDALAAASDCVLAIENYAHETQGLVATVGGFHVAPNATNVIPGQVRFSLDVRHGDDSERRRAVEGILGLIHEIADIRNVKIDVVDRSDFEAVPMDSKLVKDLILCCQAAQLDRSDIRSEKKTSDVYVLSSGAGHDAAVMASAMPSVMLFLQSPGGISHHPLESVRPSDLSIAIDAMFRFVVQQLVS
jgi:allantoate deiminase